MRFQQLAAKLRAERDKRIAWDKEFDERYPHLAAKPVQEQVRQDEVKPVVRAILGQVVNPDVPDPDVDEFNESFEEALDLLEGALYALDKVMDDQTALVPRQLRDEITDKRLDIYNFLDDYRDLEQEDKTAAKVQTKEEFIAALEAEEEEKAYYDLHI